MVGSCSFVCAFTRRLARRPSRCHGSARSGSSTLFDHRRVDARESGSVVVHQAPHHVACSLHLSTLRLLFGSV
jgi:hypothetical protein